MLAVLPMLVAAVYQAYDHYLPMVELVLTGVGGIAFAACLALYIMEQRHGRLLNPNTPHIQRARRLSQTGALWGGPTMSPKSSTEHEHLLRKDVQHSSPTATYDSIPRSHVE